MNIRVTVASPLARRTIEDAIERLMAILDRMEPDPDLEPGNDDEPSLGWPEALHGRGAGRRIRSTGGPDECEVEDEHGGDINDEPQDDDELDLCLGFYDEPGFIEGGQGL